MVVSKLPGSFGWFGGASDTVAFANDPAGHVAKKAGKHGPVFCGKIATYPCLFAAGREEAGEVMGNVSGFPPHRSILQHIAKAVGSPFILDGDAESVAFWRSAVEDSLCEEEGSPAACAVHQLLGLRPLRKDVSEQVVEAAASVSGKQQRVGSLYQHAKKVANALLLKVFLGMSPEEAAKAGVVELQTAQFRGCETLPVEGVPFASSAFEEGVAGRQQLAETIAARYRTEAGTAAPFVSRLLQRCRNHNKPIEDAAAHVAYLLHGMVPKAVASGLFYTWLHLSRRGGYDGSVAAFVAESLRVDAPVAVMPRGVACPAFSGYQLAAKHGAWQAWTCIAVANMDPKAYPDPTAHRPERWTTPPLPPPPLTFGTGPRGCVGRSLAFCFIEEATAALLASRRVPVMRHSDGLKEKTRPVRRPMEDVPCAFRQLQRPG